MHLKTIGQENSQQERQSSYPSYCVVASNYNPILPTTFINKLVIKVVGKIGF
jgi:hypothetical protein